MKTGGLNRLKIDQGGHLVAASLGGPGEGINLVAMSKKLNGAGRANWNAMEAQWRKALKADPNADIQVSVDLRYPLGSTRSSDFQVNYSVNQGDIFKETFRQ